MELRPHTDDPLFTVHIYMNGEEDMENWLPASDYPDGAMRIGNVMLTPEQGEQLKKDWLAYWADLAIAQGVAGPTEPQSPGDADPSL